MPCRQYLASNYAARALMKANVPFKMGSRVPVKANGLLRLAARHPDEVTLCNLTSSQGSNQGQVPLQTPHLSTQHNKRCFCLLLSSSALSVPVFLSSCTLDKCSVLGCCVVIVKVHAYCCRRLLQKKTVTEEDCCRRRLLQKQTAAEEVCYRRRLLASAVPSGHCEMRLSM